MKNVKVKLKLIKEITGQYTGQSKLFFVKLIKESTNLGLKQSKEVCDNLHFNLEQIVEIQPEKLEIFNKGILNFKEELMWSCRDTSYFRNLNILELRIADNIDYIDFIIENNLMINQDKDNFIKFVLSKLNREQLIEIFEQVKTSQENIKID